MKIAFIGYKDSYNYNKVGGTDAIVRRISNYIAQDNKVYLLEYGYHQRTEKIINKNIIEMCFITFQDMLLFIKQNNIKHSISIYLQPKDRVKLYFFQKSNKNLIFHTLITVYHEKFLKRNLLFLESSLTYNGNIYCVSKRIYDVMKKLSSNVVLLLPSVDDNFFKEDKTEHKKKRIGYMGRLDYGKGADLAYKYFLNSKLDRNKYEFYIYSYPWKSDKFSMELHNKLKSQNEITYIETKLFDDPKEVDRFIASIIDETDIFYLPYRFMSSTIDAPLVPMEVMARNTPFISTSLKAIIDISYSNTNLLSVEEINNINLIDNKVLKHIEEKNVYEKALKLEYKTSNISKKLLESLEKFYG